MMATRSWLPSWTADLVPPPSPGKPSPAVCTFCGSRTTLRLILRAGGRRCRIGGVRPRLDAAQDRVSLGRPTAVLPHLDAHRIASQGLLQLAPIGRVER